MFALLLLLFFSLSSVCCSCRSEPIRGRRFKCAECFDYDLDESCATKQPPVHAHKLIPLSPPRTAPLQHKFSIDRSDQSCRTPRRNKNIDSALGFLRSLCNWANQLEFYFQTRLFPIQKEHGLDLAGINGIGIFVPVIPLFEADKDQDLARSRVRLQAEESGKAAAASSSPAAAAPQSAVQPNLSLLPATSVSDFAHSNVLSLPSRDVSAFLAEQLRTLEQKIAQIGSLFPYWRSPQAKLISTQEAQVLLALLHLSKIAQTYSDGVEFIEQMLRKQLTAAIGREIQPDDFAQYMQYHNRKMFRAEYEPKPFCYAIRRPDHYPEGTMSIETTSRNATTGATQNEPIQTSVRKMVDADSWPMQFAINAATTITFGGDRYLHSCIRHQFAGVGTGSMTLSCRTRQFSSFLVLVGRINSATTFDPKHAIILQNKDDLDIPLMLETIPSAKEFKDAIESLSPEQQRFAKAIRSMQLESSLFGIVVIQLKPQLEKLLNLPDDSLTKEIALTQDLLELFIKYQIPSDLLSFDGDPLSSKFEKLASVKSNVAALQSTIHAKKDEQLSASYEEAVHSLPIEPEPMRSLGGEQYNRRTDMKMSIDSLLDRSEKLDSLEGRADALMSSGKSFSKSSGGGGFFNKLRRAFAPPIGKSVEMNAPVRGASAVCSDQADASNAPRSNMAADKRRGSSGTSRASGRLIQDSKGGRADTDRKAAPQNPVDKPVGRMSGGKTGKKEVYPEPSQPEPLEAKKQEDRSGDPDSSSVGSASAVPFDFTSIPASLDTKFLSLDEDAALRTTIINVGPTWTKKSQNLAYCTVQTYSSLPGTP
jgi:hypothetical protein